MTFSAKSALLLPFAFLAGCTGPEQVVHYACTKGMRLDVTYEETTHVVRVHDMIGQMRVLREISTDASGTVYGDAAVTFTRNNDGSAVYAARDSSHDSVTCTPPKLTAALMID